MEFLKELWHFMRVRKKFWLLPLLTIMACPAHSGIRCRAIHLHAVLTAQCASSGSQCSITTALPPSRSTAAPRRRPGGALSRKKHDARFPASAIA